MLEQGVKNAIATFTPLPADEKRRVMEESTKFLGRSVNFRADGTASSIYTPQGLHLEWKKLGIGKVTSQAVSQADQANGIKRRYLASITFETSRKWDKKANQWGQWSDTGYILFPSAITVEEINGILTPKSSILKDFKPGVGGGPAKGLQVPGIYRVKKDGKLEPVK